jgi:hypothetical protein
MGGIGLSDTYQLRLSGVVTMAVFLLVLLSDLLMLTDLNPAKPYRFWSDAPTLPQAQVTWGYYIGELAIPFLLASAWHLAQAVAPAGRWAVWTILGTTAYALPLVAVWHAAFPFTRAVLRAEIAAGAATTVGAESRLAFAIYALPLFYVGLAIAAAGYLFVFGLALAGRTLYPRWAGVALPAVYVAVAFGLRRYAVGWGDLVLGAGGWNAAGASVFALSTVVLWNGGEHRKPVRERQHVA